MGGGSVLAGLEGLAFSLVFNCEALCALVNPRRSQPATRGGPCW